MLLTRYIDIFRSDYNPRISLTQIQFTKENFCKQSCVANARNTPTFCHRRLVLGSFMKYQNYNSAERYVWVRFTVKTGKIFDFETKYLTP